MPNLCIPLSLCATPPLISWPPKLYNLVCVCLQWVYHEVDLHMVGTFVRLRAFWTVGSDGWIGVRALLHNLVSNYKGRFTLRWRSAPSRSRSLAQDMVIWGKGRYAGEDVNTIKYYIQVGVMWRSSFLSEALRLPKKLDLRRTPLLKSVRHVGSHVIFPIHVQCSRPKDSWP